MFFRTQLRQLRRPHNKHLSKTVRKNGRSHRNLNYFIRVEAGNTGQTTMESQSKNPFYLDLSAIESHQYLPNKTHYHVTEYIGNGQYIQPVATSFKYDKKTDQNIPSIVEMAMPTIFHQACTKTNLVSYIDTLKTSIKPNEIVTFDFHAHGSCGETYHDDQKGMMMSNYEYLTPKQLAEIIKKIPVTNPVIINLRSCFSGMYLSIADARTSIYTSTNDRDPSRGYLFQAPSNTYSLTNYMNSQFNLNTFFELHSSKANIDKDKTDTLILTCYENGQYKDKGIYYHLIERIYNKEQQTTDIRITISGSIQEDCHFLNREDINILRAVCANNSSINDLPKNIVDGLIKTLMEKNHMPKGYNNFLYQHVNNHCKDFELDNVWCADSLFEFIRDQLVAMMQGYVIEAIHKNHGELFVFSPDANPKTHDSLDVTIFYVSDKNELRCKYSDDRTNVIDRELDNKYRYLKEEDILLLRQACQNGSKSSDIPLDVYIALFRTFIKFNPNIKYTKLLDLYFKGDSDNLFIYQYNDQFTRGEGLFHRDSLFLRMGDDSKLNEYKNKLFKSNDLPSATIEYLNSIKDDLNYVMCKLHNIATISDSKYYRNIFEQAEMFLTFALQSGKFKLINEFIRRAKLSINPIIEEDVKNYNHFKFFSDYLKKVSPKCINQNDDVNNYDDAMKRLNQL